MFHHLLFLLRALFRHRAVEAEMDDELGFHYERQVERYLQAGLNPEEARRRARLDFGGVEGVKEECREARGVMFFETLFQDVRYGLRLLLKSPGFTAVAVLTLALGIGANTAIFSVVHAVLLKPLPYPDANRLAMIWTGLGKETRAPATGMEVAQYRERSRLFDQIAGIWVTNGTLVGEGEPEQIKLAQVTDNFLSLLCGRPEAGRFFTAGERQDGPPSVAVISYGLWNRRYGANPKIIGQAVRIGGGSVTVIGVLPRDFRLIFPEDSSVPANVDLFVPLLADLSKVGKAGFIRMVGRMVRSANVVQAQSEADEIGLRMAMGAQPLGILSMVFRQGAPAIAWGLAAGFTLSLALTPMMRGLLFGVSPIDLTPFAAVFLLLVCLSVFACYVPARRATQVDPIIALRYE